jgi:hypothetical protein
MEKEKRNYFYKERSLLEGAIKACTFGTKIWRRSEDEQ